MTDYFKLLKNDPENYLLPSFAALAFLIYPILLLLYPDTMLKDPGIGWHLKSGHYMIDNFTILKEDIFSFTRPGKEWITYEWLFQVLAAGLEKTGGLPLLSTICALIYGSLPIITFKRILKEGGETYTAMLLLIITFFGLFEHSHARPHIFTYLFFVLIIERISAYDTDRISAASLFKFVPLMVLWANLHGGFFVGLAVSGIAFIVYLVTYAVKRDSTSGKKMKTFFIFGFLLTAASLLNPFGWRLHFSILHYLKLESIHKMAEYASPNFNSVSAAEPVFLLLMLGFMVLTWRRAHVSTLLDKVLIVFFIYQSLHAVRHIFLFCLLAVPVVAKEAAAFINNKDHWLVARSKKVMTEQIRLKSDRIWIPLICLAMVCLSLIVPGLFKQDLYGPHLSREAADFIRSEFNRFKTPFNTEEIGGDLIYYFWPEMKVFGDDRNDFYGDDFYLDEYMAVLFLRSGWEKPLKKYGVSAAIVTDSNLITLMTASPVWRTVYKDKTTTIFYPLKE